MTVSPLGFNRDTGRFETVASGLTPLYKTTTYTALANEWVHANTTSAAWTLTLPSSPSVGQAVRVTDAAGTFGTNNLTVARNGQTIDGAASNFVMDVSGWDVLFEFTGATWKVIGLTPVKRLQTGAATISSSNNTGTSTVSAVNLAKAVLTFGGVQFNQTTGLNSGLARLTLTNSTTITATRDGTTGAATVSWTLVEYW